MNYVIMVVCIGSSPFGVSYPSFCKDEIRLPKLKTLFIEGGDMMKISAS